MLKNKLKNKKKGFTLIELIVVLAVLAIIALIAIPNFNRIRENSKVKADQRGADLIDKAVTTLALDGTLKNNGTYLFDGKVVTGGSVATERQEIQDVLDKTAVQQSKTTDPDGKFLITVDVETDTAKPVVHVGVGGYNSDTSTK